MRLLLKFFCRGCPPWVWRWGTQVLVLILVVWMGAYGWTNLVYNLQRLNLSLGFGFLQNQAGFNLGEAPIAFSSTDSYAWAFWVGWLNSLRVIGAGLILTTLLGVLLGLAGVAQNWLARNLALVYVEVIRNTPLLLQLFFLYGVLFLSLPPGAPAIQWVGWLYLSHQGVSLRSLVFLPGAWVWGLWGMLGLGTLLVLWKWQPWPGGVGMRKLVAGGAIATLIATLIAAFLTGHSPLGWDAPYLDPNQQVQGGLSLSAEFVALLLGLTLHTAAFIAEIVRGSLLAVPRGQWEAATALGLKPRLRMRLVIFPQALRIIVPPLTSQYLNLAKNSSLAIAIGYPDLYAVATTTLNQTGRAVEVVGLLMTVYLSLSLLIAGGMNLLNRQIQRGGVA
nr:ABC transporter permease subunit [Petrachloros mirabilis]